MDTYIVVIPSPALRIIFHLLHSNKKDIGENADIAIESLNLCSFQITIRLRYPGNHRIQYTIFPRVIGLKPFTHFMNAHAPRPNILEIKVSGRL